MYDFILKYSLKEFTTETLQSNANRSMSDLWPKMANLSFKSQISVPEDNFLFHRQSLKAFYYKLQCNVF